MPTSSVASATIGISVVFAAVLIVTVLSYWMSRKEAREADRALAELGGLLAHAREQAALIAASDRNPHQSEGFSANQDR
jgi:Zn-dependent protease with chaperone function